MFSTIALSYAMRFWQKWGIIKNVEYLVDFAKDF
jgi:hypothetical protein